MTIEDINTLNRTRKAIPDQQYKSGTNTFIGTSTGHLRLLQNASEVIFQPTATINETNVQAAVINVPVSHNAELTYVGVINDTNTLFTCSDIPNMVFRNGVLQVIGIDYNLVGKTVQFFKAPYSGSPAETLIFWKL